MRTNTIKDFGIIINTLDGSQNSHTLIKNMNILVEESSKYCPIIFYQNITHPPMFCKCCQLQQQHTWGFKSTLISTDITTTYILKNCALSPRKLFYIQDLEWLYIPQINYSNLEKIYMDPTIELLVRSKSHYEVVSKLWKKPVAIINNWNYKDIIKLLEE